MDDTFIETIHYRNFSFPIYYSEVGQQFYTIFEGKKFSFGSLNTNYKNDLKFLIDEQIDTIFYFDEFENAKLAWFYNGKFRDIKLELDNRILKVFLVADLEKINFDKLIAKSKTILSKFTKF